MTDDQKRENAKSDPSVGLQHRGSKKLQQQAVEFFHKVKEMRQHPPRGYRGKRS